MTDILKHSLKQRTFINASPDKVFDTITSADEWNKFLLSGCELEPKVGGKFIFRWKDWGPDFYTTECPGEIVEFERPSKFVFNWGRDMV